MMTRHGNTLIEVVVATMLVGVLMTAALRSTGQSLITHRVVGDRALAQMLADSLASEISQQAFQEPAATNPPLGTDAGEAGLNRLQFDDVDDYHGLNESPPAARDGSAIISGSAWRRTVQVEYVDTGTLAVSGASTAAKRITIAVQTNGTTAATASLFKTSAP